MRPSSVHVGPQVLTIGYITEKKWRKRGYDPSKMGHMWWPGGEILIRCQTDGTDLAEDNLRETLFHEILHACNEVNGLNSVGGAEAIPEEFEALEEMIVAMTSPVLLMVLRDNPDVLAYLLAVD